MHKHFVFVLYKSVLQRRLLKMRAFIISAMAVIAVQNNALAGEYVHNNREYGKYRHSEEMRQMNNAREIKYKPINESARNTHYSSAKKSKHVCLRIRPVYLADVVRKYFYSDKYVAAWGEPKSVWTKRMQILFAKDRENANKTGLGNLDFDFPSNSQDPDVKHLKIDAYKTDVNEIEVKASFKQWDKIMDIRYKFICDGKNYLLNDVESLSKSNKWLLSEILSAAE